ncbi:MAG: hypothetical protein WBD16_12740 [Pyrinomonadaceae bacterium]
MGTDSEQFIEQQRRVASAAGERSLLFALSQQLIIFSFGACSGVPDTTPPSNATSKSNNVSRLLTIFDYSSALPLMSTGLSRSTR